MTRPLDAFIGQVEREFGGTIACVGDQKNRLAGLLFEVASDLVDGFGERTPAAQSIARVASSKIKPAIIHQQSDEERAHHQAENDRDSGPILGGDARRGTLAPIGNRKNAEAEESETVPVRRGGLVQ